MKLLTRILFLCGLIAASLCAMACAYDNYYEVVGGNIYFQSGVVTNCDQTVTNAVIPSKIGSATAVTSIASSAFAGRKSLISVTIPDSVTSIGNEAFSGCTSLTSVVIPDSVISIGSNAFAGCKSLKSVKIGNSVTSLGFDIHSAGYTGYNAFQGCASLTSVEIPSSVTDVGNLPFSGCASLTSIAVESGNENYASADGVLFSKSQTSLIRYPAGKPDLSYQIPDGVVYIRGNAFENCANLTSVKIPDSVTSIGASPSFVFSGSAFSGCANLTSVEIGDGVSAIKDHAFFGCANLANVKFGNSVTDIENEAFSGCASLTSVDLPNSVTYIGDSAFFDCASLANVKFGDSVTYIGYEAFSGCASLTSLNIPNSVTSIEYNAFNQCDALRNVYYSGSKEQWEEISGISDSQLISDSITVHYSGDAPTTPEIQVASAPTVNGHAIGKADLSGLTEIVVPLSVSVDAPTSVTICVPFYNGNGKFVGMGFVTATVDKNTTSVAAPVAADVSGSEKLSVIFLDKDFRPLSAAYSCPIA